ncbi:suppressor of fused domain protein [Pseudolactococcus yaeyamensis]
MGLFDFLKKKAPEEKIEKVIEKADMLGQITFAEYKERVEDEEYAPGWQAIDEVFGALYPGQEPSHLGTLLTSRAIFGGTEYLDGYLIYQSDKGYYHIVTYGVSQLYADAERYGETYSKWGYEMTFKLKADSVEECHFAMNMLGNLARYTFTSDKYFSDNEYVLGDGSPIKQGADSKIASLLITQDTELPTLNTVHGEVQFLQLIGITYEDGLEIKESGGGYECVKQLLSLIKQDNPDLVTDLASEKTYMN